MILWNEYRILSREFLAQHHDLVLYDVFHHVVAFLLYPPCCSCEENFCQCDSTRRKIALSLNLDFYNKLKERHEDSELLTAMRLLLKIPEESYFQKHYTSAYPSQLISKDFNQEEKNFKYVDQLAWTLLRLFKTHQLSIFKEAKTSISESLEVILGNTPVKTKRKKGSEEDLGGQHAYKKQFKRYKAVTHFILALQFMKKANEPGEPLLFAWNQPDRIDRFLSLSHWFRQKLLLLRTPNSTKKEMFLDTTFEAFPKLSKAEELLAWMRKQSTSPETTLTRRFIIRYSKFRSSKDLDLLLSDLIQMGYIQEMSQNTFCLIPQANQ